MPNARKTKSLATPTLHLHGRPTLRVLGTEITLLEQIRERAEADLGVTLVFENLDFVDSSWDAYWVEWPA